MQVSQSKAILFTRANGGPVSHHFSMDFTSLSFPSNTASTLPSGRFFTQLSRKVENTQNNWDDAFLAGDGFKTFLTEDIAKVKTTLTEIGLVK